MHFMGNAVVSSSGLYSGVVSGTQKLRGKCELIDKMNFLRIYFSETLQLFENIYRILNSHFFSKSKM